MSQLELIGELRGCRPAVSPSLQERVDAIVAAEQEPQARRRVSLPSWSLRRIAFVAAPAGIALAAVGAVVFGLASPSSTPSPVALDGTGHGAASTKAFLAPHSAATIEDQAAPPTPRTPGGFSTSTGTGAAVPVQRGRAQIYEADISLRVANLSASTKRLLNMTRGYGGYVRTVDYGQGAKSGTAYVVVRIPIGSVQAAIVRFTAMGAIIDQHVQIQDVQQSVDVRFRQMQVLRTKIVAAQKRHAAAEVTALQAQLLALQKLQVQVHRQTSYATVGMELTTKKAAAVVPVKKESRLGRGLDRAGRILSTELLVLLYIAIVGIPIAVFVALGVSANRLRRRRVDERLLASS